MCLISAGYLWRWGSPTLGERCGWKSIHTGCSRWLTPPLTQGNKVDIISTETALRHCWLTSISLKLPFWLLSAPALTMAPCETTGSTIIIIIPIMDQFYLISSLKRNRTWRHTQPLSLSNYQFVNSEALLLKLFTFYTGIMMAQYLRFFIQLSDGNKFSTYKIEILLVRRPPISQLYHPSSS